MTSRQSGNAREGYVLIAVLVVVVLLMLAGYQYSELTFQEYRAADSSLRALQAKAAADSGVYYAAALLANPDSMSGTLNNNPFNNDSAFSGIQVSSDTRSGRTTRFSIVAANDPDNNSSSQLFRYGVIDEAGKINLNALIQIDSSGQVAHDALMKLPNMTEEIADAIIDWIDADDDPRPSGAESQTYQGMVPPYRCKNGPLDSVEELLLVRGVTPQLLFGTDRNRNGIQDPGEDDGGGWDPGWAGYLTVYSRERNVDNDGNPRTFLNDTDLKGQYDKIKAAFDESFADYFVLYRTQTASGGSSPMPPGQRTRAATAQEIRTKVDSVINGTGSQQQQRPKSLSSRYELINTSIQFTVGQGRNQQTVTVACPLNDVSQRNTLLPALLDKTTTQQTTELPARVNVNTAPKAVLAALPGLTESDVQAILDHQLNLAGGDTPDEASKTPAWLITEANISIDKMRALERYITARTQVYRVQVIASYDRGGPMARVEAVIDTNDGKPRILLYRDLTELGRGYDLSK